MIDTTTHTNYSTYIMAFGAHPDDSDVGVGGTILRAVDHGHTAIMVDLTPSQRSTHGDPQTRQAEAQLAASRLSPQTRIDRINMGYTDTQLVADDNHIMPIVQLIRSQRPEIILTQSDTDPHHPDHQAVGRIIHKAIFVAGLAQVSTVDPDGNPHQPHRPRLALSYTIRDTCTPQLVIPLTAAQHEQKWHAIDAFVSQRPAIDREFFVTRERLLGRSIGSPYGEGLSLLHGSIGITSLDDLSTKPF